MLENSYDRYPPRSLPSSSSSSVPPPGYSAQHEARLSSLSRAVGPPPPPPASHLYLIPAPVLTHSSFHCQRPSSSSSPLRHLSSTASSSLSTHPPAPSSSQSLHSHPTVLLLPPSCPSSSLPLPSSSSAPPIPAGSLRLSRSLSSFSQLSGGRPRSYHSSDGASIVFLEREEGERPRYRESFPPEHHSSGRTEGGGVGHPSLGRVGGEGHIPQHSYRSERETEDDGDDDVMFSSGRSSRDTHYAGGSQDGRDPSVAYRSLSRDSSSYHPSHEASSSTHQYRPFSHSLQPLPPSSLSRGSDPSYSSSRSYYEDSSHIELAAYSSNPSQEGISSSSLGRGEIGGVASHSHAWSLPPHRSTGLAPPSASAGSSYYPNPSFSSSSSSVYSPGSLVSVTLPPQGRQHVEDEGQSGRSFLAPFPPPPLVDLCSPISSSSFQQDQPHPPGPAIFHRGATASSSSSSLSVDRRGIGRVSSDSHEYFISRDQGGRAGEETRRNDRLPGHHIGRTTHRGGEEGRGRRDGEGRGEEEEEDEGRVSICSSVSHMSLNEGSRAREVFSSCDDLGRSERFPCLGRDGSWGGRREREGRREARRQVVQIGEGGERKQREEEDGELPCSHSSPLSTRRVVTYDGVSSSPPPYSRHPVSGDIVWKKTVSASPQEAVPSTKDDFHRLHTTEVPKGGREISFCLSLGGPTRHPLRSSSSSPAGRGKERMTSSSRKDLPTSPSIDEGNKTERHEKKEESRLSSSSHHQRQKSQTLEAFGVPSSVQKDSTLKGSSPSGSASLASQTPLQLSKGSGGRPSPLALSPNISSCRDVDVSTGVSVGGAERHEGKKGDQQEGSSQSVLSLQPPLVSPTSELPPSQASSLRSSLVAPSLAEDGKEARSSEKGATPLETREGGAEEGRGESLVCSSFTAFPSQTTRLSRSDTSLFETSSSRPTAPQAASSSSSRPSAPAPSSSICSPPAVLATRPADTPTSCPPATPVSRPPATTASRPPATAASRPPPTAASRPPPGTAASRPPPGTAASRPPPTAASRPPPGTAASRPPPGTEASRPPPGTAASRPPPGTEASRPPPATAVSRPPPATAASRPPPGTAASRPPPATAVSRPAAAPASRPPPGTAASRPRPLAASSSSVSRPPAPPTSSLSSTPGPGPAPFASSRVPVPCPSSGLPPPAASTCCPPSAPPSASSRLSSPSSFSSCPPAPSSSSSHPSPPPPPSSSSSLQGVRSSSFPSSCPLAPAALSSSSSHPVALLPAPLPLSSSSPSPPPLSAPPFSSRPPSPITPPSSYPSEHEDARKEAEGSNTVPENNPRQKDREEREELLVALTSSPGVTIEKETGKGPKDHSIPVVEGGCLQRKKEEDDDNMDLGEDDDDEVICIGEKQQSGLWFSPSSSPSSSSKGTTVCKVSKVLSKSHHGRKAEGGATIVLGKDNKQPKDSGQGFSRWDRRERRREGGEVEGKEGSRRTVIPTAKAVTSDSKVTHVSCETGPLHRGGEGGGRWGATDDHKEEKMKKREEGEEIRLAVKAALDRVEEFYTMGGGGGRGGGGESKERGLSGRSKRSDGRREEGQGEQGLSGRISRRTDEETEEDDERQRRNNRDLDSEGRDRREASVMVVRLAGGREQRDKQREAEIERRERHDRGFWREEPALLRREEERERGGCHLTFLRPRNQEEGNSIEEGEVERRRRSSRASVECDIVSSRGLNEVKRRDFGCLSSSSVQRPVEAGGKREEEQEKKKKGNGEEERQCVPDHPYCLRPREGGQDEEGSEKRRERDSEREELQGDPHSLYHCSSDISAASPPGVFSSHSHQHRPPVPSSRNDFNRRSSSSSSLRSLHEFSYVETFPPPPSCSSSPLTSSRGDSHRLSSQPLVSRDPSPLRSSSSSSRSARLYLEYRSRPPPLPPSSFSPGLSSEGYGRRRTSRSSSSVSPRCKRDSPSADRRLPYKPSGTARPSSPTRYSIHGQWSSERGERHQDNRERRRERSRSGRRTRSFSPFSRRRHHDSSSSKSPSRCRRFSPRDYRLPFSPKSPRDSSTWGDHRHSNTYRHYPPHYGRTEPSSSSSRSPSRTSPPRFRFPPPSLSSSCGDGIAGGRPLLSSSRQPPPQLPSYSYSHGGHQEMKTSSYENELNRNNSFMPASIDSQTGVERNISSTSPPSDHRPTLPPLFSSSSYDREGRRTRRGSSSSPSDRRTEDKRLESPRQGDPGRPPPLPAPSEKTCFVVGSSRNVSRSAQPQGAAKSHPSPLPPLSSSSSSVAAPSSHHTPSAIRRNWSRSDDDMSWSRNTVSSSPSMSTPRGGVHTPEVLHSHENLSCSRDVSSKDFLGEPHERRKVFVWREGDREEGKCSALHHPGGSHRKDAPRTERNGEKDKSSSPGLLDGASQRKLATNSRDNELPSLRSKSRGKQNEKDGGGHDVWVAREGGDWAKEIPEEREGRGFTGEARTPEKPPQRNASPLSLKTGSLQVSSSSSFSGSSMSRPCRVEGGKTSLSLSRLEGPEEKKAGEICTSSPSHPHKGSRTPGHEDLSKKTEKEEEEKSSSQKKEGGGKQQQQEGIQKGKEREEKEQGKRMRVDSGEGDHQAPHRREEEGREREGEEEQEKRKGVEEATHSHSPLDTSRGKTEVAKASDKEVSQSDTCKDKATRNDEGNVSSTVDEAEGSGKLDSRCEKQDRDSLKEKEKDQPRKREEQEKNSPTEIFSFSTPVPSLQGPSSPSSSASSSSSSSSSSMSSSSPPSSSSCASSSSVSSSPSPPPASSPSSSGSFSSSSSSSSMSCSSSCSSLPPVSSCPALSSPSAVLSSSPGSLLSTVCGSTQLLQSRQYEEKCETQRMTQESRYFLLVSPDLPPSTEKGSEDARKEDKQPRKDTDSGRMTNAGLSESHAVANSIVGRQDTRALAAAVQAQREEGVNLAPASSSPGRDRPREGKNEEVERQGREGEERERGRGEQEGEATFGKVGRSDEPEKRKKMSMEHTAERIDGRALFDSAETRKEGGGENIEQRREEGHGDRSEEENTEKVKKDVPRLQGRERNQGEVRSREIEPKSVREEVSRHDNPVGQPASVGEDFSSLKERRKGGEITASAQGTSLQHPEGKDPSTGELKKSFLASLPPSHQSVSTPLPPSASSPTLSSSASPFSSSSTSLSSTKPSSSSSLSSPASPPVRSSLGSSSSVAFPPASESTAGGPTANPPCAVSSRSPPSSVITISSLGSFKGNEEEGRKEGEKKGTVQRDEPAAGSSHTSAPKEVDGGGVSSVISMNSSSGGSCSKSSASSPSVSPSCDGSSETRKQSHNVPSRWDVKGRISPASSTSSASFSSTGSSSPSSSLSASTSSSSSFSSTSATTSSSASPSPSPLGGVILTKNSHPSERTLTEGACLSPSSPSPSPSSPPSSSSYQPESGDTKDVVSSNVPSCGSPPSLKETEGSCKASSASVTRRETPTTTGETRGDEREMKPEGQKATPIRRRDEEGERKSSSLQGEKEQKTKGEMGRRESQIDLTGEKTSPLPRVVSSQTISSMIASSTSPEAAKKREGTQILPGGLLPKTSREEEEFFGTSCLVSDQERKAREEHEISRRAYSPPPPPLPSSPSNSALVEKKTSGVLKETSETGGENSKKESYEDMTSHSPIMTASPSGGAVLSKGPPSEDASKKTETSHLVSPPSSTVIKTSTLSLPPSPPPCSSSSSIAISSSSPSLPSPLPASPSLETKQPCNLSHHSQASSSLRPQSGGTAGAAAKGGGGGAGKLEGMFERLEAFKRRCLRYALTQKPKTLYREESEVTHQTEASMMPRRTDNNADGGGQKEKENEEERDRRNEASSVSSHKTVGGSHGSTQGEGVKRGGAENSSHINRSLEGREEPSSSPSFSGRHPSTTTTKTRCPVILTPSSSFSSSSFSSSSFSFSSSSSSSSLAKATTPPPGMSSSLMLRGSSSSSGSRSVTILSHDRTEQRTRESSVDISSFSPPSSSQDNRGRSSSNSNISLSPPPARSLPYPSSPLEKGGLSSIHSKQMTLSSQSSLSSSSFSSSSSSSSLISPSFYSGEHLNRGNSNPNVHEGRGAFKSVAMSLPPPPPLSRMASHSSAPATVSLLSSSPSQDKTRPATRREGGGERHEAMRLSTDKPLPTMKRTPATAGGISTRGGGGEGRGCLQGGQGFHGSSGTGGRGGGVGSTPSSSSSPPPTAAVINSKGVVITSHLVSCRRKIISAGDRDLHHLQHDRNTATTTTTPMTSSLLSSSSSLCQKKNAVGALLPPSSVSRLSGGSSSKTAVATAAGGGGREGRNYGHQGEEISKGGHVRGRGGVSGGGVEEEEDSEGGLHRRKSVSNGGRSMMRNSVHAPSMEIKTGAAAGGKGEGGISLLVSQRGGCRDTIGGHNHMKNAHSMSSGGGHINSHSSHNTRRRRIEVDDSLLIDLGQDEEEEDHDEKADVSSSSSSSFLFSSGSSTTSSARLHTQASSSSLPSSASSSSSFFSPSRLSSSSFSSPPPSRSIASSSSLNLSSSPPSKTPGSLEEERKDEEKGLFLSEAQQNDLSSNCPPFSPPLRGGTPPSHSPPPITPLIELRAGEPLAQSSSSSSSSPSKPREGEMMKKKQTREEEEEERRLTTTASRGGEEKRYTAQVASFQKRGGSESVLASKSTPPSLLNKSGPPRLRRQGDSGSSSSSTPPSTTTFKDNRGRESSLHDGLSPPSSSPPFLGVSSSQQTRRRTFPTTVMKESLGDRFPVTRALPSLPASPQENENRQPQQQPQALSSSPPLLSTGKALARVKEGQGGVLSLPEEMRKEEQIRHNYKTGHEGASSTKTVGKETFPSSPAHVEEKEPISLPPLPSNGKKIHGRLSGGSLSEDGEHKGSATSSTRRRRRSTRRPTEVKGGGGNNDVTRLSSSSSSLVSLAGPSLHHVDNSSSSLGGGINSSTGDLQRIASRSSLPSETSQLACPTAVRTRGEEEEEQHQEKETGEEKKKKSRESQDVTQKSPGAEESTDNHGDRIIPHTSSTTTTAVSSKDSSPISSSIVTPLSCSSSSSSSSCLRAVAKGSPTTQDRTGEAILPSSSFSSLPTDLSQKKKRKSLSSSSSVSSLSVSASSVSKIESFLGDKSQSIKKSCMKKTEASSTLLVSCGVPMQKGGDGNMTKDGRESALLQVSHLLHQQGGENRAPDTLKPTHTTLTSTTSSSASSSPSFILYSGCLSEGDRIKTNTEREENVSPSFLSASGNSVSLSSPSSSGNSLLVQQKSSVSCSSSPPLSSSSSSSPGVGKIPLPVSTVQPWSARGSHEEVENRKKNPEERQYPLSGSCSSSLSSPGYLKREDRRRDEEGEKNGGEKGHSVSPIRPPHVDKRIVLSPRPSTKETTLSSASSVSSPSKTAAPSSGSGPFLPSSVSTSSSSLQPSTSSSSCSSSNTHSRSSITSSLSPSSSLCSSSPSPKHISTSLVSSKTFSSSSLSPIQTSSTSRSHLSSPSHSHPPSSSAPLPQSASAFPSSDKASPSVHSSASISSSHLLSSLVFLQKEEAEARVREVATRARHMASIHRLKCLMLEVKEAQKEVERLGQERFLATRQVSLMKMKVERLEKLLLHQGKTGKSSVSKVGGGGGEEERGGKEGALIDPSVKMKMKGVATDSQKNQLQNVGVACVVLPKSSQQKHSPHPPTASSPHSKNKSSRSMICQDDDLDYGIEKNKRNSQQGNVILPSGDGREGRMRGEEEREGGEEGEAGREGNHRMNDVDDLYHDEHHHERGSSSSHTTETFLSRLRERKKEREIQEEEEKKKGDALLSSPALVSFETSGRSVVPGKRKLETHDNDEEERETQEGKTWKANNANRRICCFSSSSSSLSSSFSLLVDTIGEECEKPSDVACGLEKDMPNPFSSSTMRLGDSLSSSSLTKDDSLGVSTPSYESLPFFRPSSSPNPSLLLGVDTHSNDKTLVVGDRKPCAGREEEEEKDEVLEFLPLPPIGSSRSFHRQHAHQGRKDPSSSSSLSSSLTTSLPSSSSSSPSLSSVRRARGRKSLHTESPQPPTTSSPPLHSCEAEVPERLVVGKKHGTKKMKPSEREREHGVDRLWLICVPGHPKSSSAEEEEEDHKETRGDTPSKDEADECFSFSSSPRDGADVGCPRAINNSREIFDKGRRRRRIEEEESESTTRKKDDEWGEEEKKKNEVYFHHGKKVGSPKKAPLVKKDEEEEEKKEKKKSPIHHGRGHDARQGGKKSDEVALPPPPVRPATYVPQERRRRYFHLHFSPEEKQDTQEKVKDDEKKKKKEDERQEHENREDVELKKNRKKEKGDIKEKGENKQNSQTNEKNEAEEDDSLFTEKRSHRVIESEECLGEEERRSLLPCTSVHEGGVKVGDSEAGDSSKDNAVSSILKKSKKDLKTSKGVTASDEEPEEERMQTSKKEKTEDEKEEEENKKNKATACASSFSSCSSSRSSRFFDVEEDYIPLVEIEDRKEKGEKVREGLLHFTERQAVEKKEEKKKDEEKEGQHSRTSQWREEDFSIRDLHGVQGEIAARVDIESQAKKADSNHNALEDKEKKKKEEEEKKKDKDLSSSMEKGGEESRMVSPLNIHDERGEKNTTKINRRTEEEEDRLTEETPQSSSSSLLFVPVAERLTASLRQDDHDEVRNKEKTAKGGGGGGKEEGEGEGDEKEGREEKVTSGDGRALQSLSSSDLGEKSDDLRGSVDVSLPSRREEESPAAAAGGAGDCVFPRNEECGEKEIGLLGHQKGKNSPTTPSDNFLSLECLSSAVERKEEEEDKEEEEEEEEGEIHTVFRDEEEEEREKTEMKKRKNPAARGRYFLGPDSFRSSPFSSSSSLSSSSSQLDFPPGKRRRLQHANPYPGVSLDEAKIEAEEEQERSREEQEEEREKEDLSEMPPEESQRTAALREESATTTTVIPRRREEVKGRSSSIHEEEGEEEREGDEEGEKAKDVGKNTRDVGGEHQAEEEGEGEVCMDEVRKESERDEHLRGGETCGHDRDASSSSSSTISSVMLSSTFKFISALKQMRFSSASSSSKLQGGEQNEEARDRMKKKEEEEKENRGVDSSTGCSSHEELASMFQAVDTRDLHGVKKKKKEEEKCLGLSQSRQLQEREPRHLSRHVEALKHGANHPNMTTMKEGENSRKEVQEEKEKEEVLKTSGETKETANLPLQQSSDCSGGER